MDLPSYPPAPPYASPPPPPGANWNGKTNGFSIAALTFALLGCTGAISIVFGIIGLRQSRRNGDKRGRIFAIVALSICAFWISVIAVIAVIAVARDIADGPDRDASGTVRGERSITVLNLRPGDCLKDLAHQTGSYVDALPCSSAHDSEVFATYELPVGSPTEKTAADKLADAGCEQRYEAYTGQKEPGTDSFVFTVRKADLSSKPNERGVICIAHQYRGTRTGSLKR